MGQTKPSVQPVISNNDSDSSQESAGSVHGLDSSDDETTHNYNELKDLMITEEVLCTWLLDKWDLQHVFTSLKDKQWSFPEEWHGLTEQILIWEVDLAREDAQQFMK